MITAIGCLIYIFSSMASLKMKEKNNLNEYLDFFFFLEMKDLGNPETTGPEKMTFWI